MRILKMYIKSFGNLRDFSIEPSMGINIIHGENESGKSTLAAFIKFMFYGFPPRKGRDTSFSTAERYINWDTHSASGSLEVMFNESIYRIEREVYRQGKKIAGSVKVLRLPEGVQVSDAPDTFFLEGAPEEMFNRTVFISQAEGAVFDAETIHTSVENMLSGADESLNTKKALSKLDSARITLLYKNEKGGKIYSLRRKLEELRDKKYAMAKQSSSMEVLKTEIEELEKNTAIIKNELQELLKSIEELENGERLERIEHTQKARESLERYENDLKLYKKSVIKNGLLPDKDYLKDLDTLTKEYYSILETIKDLALYKDDLKRTYETEQDKDTGRDIRLDEIEKNIFQRIEKIEKLQKLSKPFLISSIVLGALFLLSLIAIKPLALFSGSFFALSVLFWCGIKYAIHFLNKICLDDLAKVGAEDLDELKKFKQNQEKMSKKRNDIAGKIGEIEAQIKEKNQSLKKTLEKLSLLSGKYGTEVSSIGECEDFKESIKSIVDKLEQDHRYILEKKEELRLNAESFTDEEYEALKKKTENVNLPEDIHSTLISLKLEKRNKERALEVALSNLNDKKLLLTSLGAGFEDEMTLAKKEEKLVSELKRLTLAHEALILASEALEKAMTAARDRIAPMLSSLSSEFIKDATNGRYNQVNVDASLKLSYTAEGTTRPPEHLSESTKDIVYLAFRISLVSILFPDTPPVIIDEGFAGMDDERLSFTLSALANRAKELSYQIFLFSPTTREALVGDKLGANIINMPKRQ